MICKSGRFRYVHQQYAMQCGVACLAMVCSTFGRMVPLNVIEAVSTPTPQGVSLKALADGARALGLDAAPVKVTVDFLLQGSDFPIILHWNQNHFVVVRRLSRSKKKLLIADPAKGEQWISIKEVETHWLPDTSQPKGIALLLKPTEEFYRQADTDLNASETIKGALRRFLRKWFWPHKRTLAIVILTLIVGSLVQLVFPFLTQQIVDRGVAGKNIPLIWLILLGELMLICGRTLTGFIRIRLLLRISIKINIGMLSEFFSKLMRLPMAFFETKFLGDLTQRMSDHGRVYSFLTGQALTIAFALLSFVVFGTVLCVYSVRVFAVFIIGSAAYLGWVSVFLRRRRVLDFELFEAQAINQNKTYQMLTTMQEIKLHDCRERRSNEWEQAQRQLFDIQFKSLRLSQTQEGGRMLINEITNILITVVSASAVVRGEMTLGAMLAIQFVVGQLSSPVEQIMAFVYSLQDLRISMERIQEIQSRKDEDDDTEEASSLSLLGKGDAGITIHGLNFRYDRHNPAYTLTDINLNIPQNAVTAIVGASGSGKSTLLKLMLGFYRPERGEVLIGGHDLNSLAKTSWRSHCGVVMQEGVIFSDSIAHNIAMTDDIDHERMCEAARLANLAEMIDSLPLGYNTKIGAEGSGLSKGQKQRILIARAIYKNPDYIFLDEATNSLDASSELEITNNLEGFFVGRTVIVVAHRLSTVRNADNIVVLHKGRIVEQGSHQELILRRGHYYTLIKNQLELGD